MNEKLKFEQQMEVASLHAQRIKEAIEELRPSLPITLEFMEHVNITQRGCLEIAIHRFAKLQDLLGNTIFPLIITCAEKTQENQTYIDQLNILEKMELLPSRLEWIEMRRLRNKIAHDYPCDTEATVNETNKVLISAEKLVLFWHELLPKIQPIAAKFFEQQSFLDN